MAQAQVAAVGKGWLLDVAGSITTAPSEVLSGRYSIKGSYAGPNGFTPFLHSDPTFIRFTPHQTYTVTARYRIIQSGSGSFDLAINSNTANGAGVFGPGTGLKGAAGTTGTVTLTAALQGYADYHLSFGIVGTGEIVIDDIRIVDAAGRLFAAENVEGPALAAGPLNFRLIDALTLVAPSNGWVRSVAAKDLDGDGHPEAILTLTAPAPSATAIAPIVIESSAQIRLATDDFFPDGVPTVKHSPSTLFADVDGDGLEDILFAEAGYDMAPQQPGAVIGIALNLGGGRYRNVSALVPADLRTTRSYALAAGDLDGDGRAEILLPDEDNGANTALLRWNGSGFDAQRNWIAPSLWTGPAKLVHNSWLAIADFDRDGRPDLLVGAAPIPGTPTLRILFGSPTGFSANGLVTLPDGLFGNRTSFPIQQTSDCGPLVVADLDNDGLPDIFAFEEQALNYQPGTITDTNEPGYADLLANGGVVFADVGLQVLLNQGGRRFADVSSASTVQNLGRRHYFATFAIDMNNDGFLDIVGLYTTKRYGADTGGLYGTTVFLNDGTGAFQAVDGAQLIGATTMPPGASRWNLGSFVPMAVNRERTEGIVLESVGGCGLGFCPAPRVNLYKVLANGALGTGPGFADPATLGVPGFNEFYYLRHHPDAAAAVQAGQYAHGLTHYVAVGRALGHLPSAVAGVPVNLAASTSGSSVTLRWSPPPSGSVSSYVLEAGSAPGLSDIASLATGSTATSLSVTGVASGTYHVRVRATIAGATGGPSNEVVVQVGPSPCTAEPGTPSGLTALVVGSTVTLRWAASPGSPRTYLIDAGSAPGLTDIGRLELGNTTMFTVPGVAPGTYYGRIRAMNACGTSGTSNEVAITVGGPFVGARARRAP